MKFDNKQLLERLTKQQQSIIDKLQQQVGPDTLGEVLDRMK